MGPGSTISPFGGLLEDLRGAGARVPAPRPARPQIGPEPDLLLECGVVSGGRARPSRSWRWAPAVVVHAAFLAAAVAVPLLLPDELPSPVTGARVFFVESIAPPPPPPPPALPQPAGRTAAPRPSVATTRPTTPVSTVARAEVKPEELMPPASLDPPMAPSEEGVPGGVDEGVPGGIVGGVIEKVSATEPVSPTLRVGGAIKEPRKLKNVAPVYPDVAARGLVEGVVILEIAIEPSGHVDDVRVLRSIPLLDAAAVAAARQWVFAPTLYRGVPVSVTMTVSVRFSLTLGASAS